MNNEHLIEKALRYIEAHLTQKLCLEDIAEAANYSPWHFHRLFFACYGITVGEYIRKRRMSEASRELAFSDRPIKQIAAEYQFESQAAFSRSFKNFCGTSPGKMRQQLKPILCFEAITKKPKKGEIMQQPKIIHQPGFRVIGKTCRSTMNNNTIPALWDEFNKVCSKIPGAIEEGSAYGICYFEEITEMTNDTPFTYLAGIKVANDQAAGEGLVTRDVPAADYAVFEHHGSLETLGQTYDSIYSNWLPDSGYNRKDSDDFERYDERFQYGKPESVMEIWVPVIKK